MRRILLSAAVLLPAILVAGLVASCSDDLTEPTSRRSAPLPAHIPISLATASTASGATFTTDKDDYAPGETVRLAGTGWQPGDSLDILLDEEPQNHPPVAWAVGVDENGGFTDSTYVVQESDAGVTFALTATSRATGETATATFTDGNSKIQSNKPGVTFTVTATKYVGSGDCTTGTQTTTTPTIDNSGTNFSANPASGPNPAESYKFVAAALSDQSPGAAFVNWTTTEPVVSNVGNTICVAGFSSAQRTYTANYNAAPDLGISKAAAGAFAVGSPGGTYDITVSNTGTATAEGAVGNLIKVTDALPTGLTFVSGGSANGWQACSAVGQNVSCNLATGQAIAPSGSRAFSIVVNVSTDACPSVTNTANVSGGNEPAGNAGNNGSGNVATSIDTGCPSANNPPVLGSIGNQTVDEEIELAFTATATDENVSTLKYSLANPASGTFPTGASITQGGAFTWTPTEAQGPGVYRVKIVVTDEGSLTDEEEIQITVNEVNKPPVLTVPASFSTQWGVAISGKQATATDPDDPANTLTFSLVTFPTGMTINATSGVISWTPTSSQLGPNPVTVKVEDDGSPVMSDQESFTITVLARPTALVYDGSLSGQYSDQSKLSATLTDAGDGALNGTAISGETIAFTFAGASAGSDATDANGKAEVLYTIPKPDGNYNVAATFTAADGYLGSTDNDNTFDVDPEDATVTPDAANQNAYKVLVNGGTGSFTLIFRVNETYVPPEPQVNDGALAGDINNAGLTAILASVASGGTITGSCSASVSGSGYSAIKTFTCSFSNVPVDAYVVTAAVANGGSPSGAYYRGKYDDALTVYDPSLGFVTGGGKFILDGDRVSFGLSFTYTGKGKTNPRGNIVVIRHHADGSSCRTKSNGLDAPAVSGNTASFTGKANYGCVDATGYALPGGAGNLTLTGYVEDNGEPGSSAAVYPDKFWVRVSGELLMPTPAAPNAAPLTGGNIQVPQPQGNKK